MQFDFFADLEPDTKELSQVQYQNDPQGETIDLILGRNGVFVLPEIVRVDEITCARTERVLAILTPKGERIEILFMPRIGLSERADRLWEIWDRSVLLNEDGTYSLDPAWAIRLVKKWVKEIVDGDGQIVSKQENGSTIISQEELSYVKVSKLVH